MMKRQYLNVFAKQQQNIKKYLSRLAPLAFFYILLYRVEPVRKFCKAVVLYLIKAKLLPVSMETVKNSYFVGEKLCLLELVLTIASVIMMWAIRWLNDYLTKQEAKNMGQKSRMEESLFRYLREGTAPRCYLVTGEWGSGKTYEIDHFFEKYYKYSNRKIYRISCFGISSRKELIEEINNTIEREDDSFYTFSIQALKYIPVVGDALYKVLKKSYRYTSVPTGSVFIFDDFERITARMCMEENNIRETHYSPRMYRQISTVDSEKQAFSAISDGFKETERAFAQIRNFSDRQLDKQDYDKYIAAVGMINELVEVCGMKAIIICNSDMLGEKFIYEVLRSKLNCIEFKKIVTVEVTKTVMDTVLQSIHLENEEQQKKIADYLKNYARKPLEGVVANSEFRNMRLYCSLLEAFINTAALFTEEQLSFSFLNSLLNSIIIVHLCYYRNLLQKLQYYENGAYLPFLLTTFNDVDLLPYLIRCNDETQEVAWVDVSVSGYWILNMRRPENAGKVYDEWLGYSYSEVEWKITTGAIQKLESDEFKLVHALAFGKRYKDANRANEIFTEHALEEYELTTEQEVLDVLQLAEEVFGDKDWGVYRNILFKIIVDKFGRKHIAAKTSLQRAFNYFVDNTMTRIRPSASDTLP